MKQTQRRTFRPNLTATRTTNHGEQLTSNRCFHAHREAELIQRLYRSNDANGYDRKTIRTELYSEMNFITFFFILSQFTELIGGAYRFIFDSIPRIMQDSKTQEKVDSYTK